MKKFIRILFAIFPLLAFGAAQNVTINPANGQLNTAEQNTYIWPAGTTVNLALATVLLPGSTSSVLITYSVPSVAQLRAFSVTSVVTGTYLQLSGYYANGDGGGGIFYYDSSSSLADNGGTIIQPTVGIGRWIRVFSGPINVRWFGAKADNTNNDTIAVRAAIALASSNGGGVVYLPAGTYKVYPQNAGEDCLTISSSNVQLIGDGRESTTISCYTVGGQLPTVSGTFARGRGIVVQGTGDVNAPTANIAIRKLKIYGNAVIVGDPTINPNSGTQWDTSHQGVILLNDTATNNVELSDCEISNFLGELTYCSGSLHRRFVVARNIIHQSNADGMSYSADAHVDSNIVYDVAHACVESVHGPSQNGYYTNNLFEPRRTLVSHGDYGVSLATFSGGMAQVQGNVIKNCQEFGMDLPLNYRLTVKDNVLIDCGVGDVNQGYINLIARNAYSSTGVLDSVEISHNVFKPQTAILGPNIISMGGQNSGITSTNISITDNVVEVSDAMNTTAAANLVFLKYSIAAGYTKFSSPVVSGNTCNVSRYSFTDTSIGTLVANRPLWSANVFNEQAYSANGGSFVAASDGQQMALGAPKCTVAANVDLYKGSFATNLSKYPEGFEIVLYGNDGIKGLQLAPDSSWNRFPYGIILYGGTMWAKLKVVNGLFNLVDFRDGRTNAILSGGLSGDNGTATIQCQGATRINLAPSVDTTYTGFTQMGDNAQITIFLNGHVTLQNNSNIKLNGATNFVVGGGSNTAVIQFVSYNSTLQEVARYATNPVLTSGTSLLAGNGTGGFQNVTLTSNLTYNTSTHVFDTVQGIQTNSSPVFGGMTAFAANGPYIISQSNSASAGQAQFVTENDQNAYLRHVVYGSTFAGTSFGLSNSGLALIETDTGGSTYPTALAIGTLNNTPVVFGVNNVEVGRFTSSVFDTNSIKSYAASTFTIGTTSFGTSITLASATGIPTFGTHIVLEGVTSTGATGSGNFVFSLSPTLTTPVLGAALATSISGNAFSDLGLNAGAGANNNVNITPTGTGAIVVTGSGAAGTGLINMPAGTTIAQGIRWSNDAGVFRSGGSQLSILAGQQTNFSTNGIQFANSAMGFLGSNNAKFLDFSDAGGTPDYFRITNTNGGGTATLSAVGGSAAINIVLTPKGTGTLNISGKVGAFNGVTVAGMGLTPVVSTPRSTAVTNATTSLTAYTAPAVDSSYEVSANVNVTATTAAAMTVTCTYTDETNTSRTLTLGFVQLSGATLLTSITNATGTGPYESPAYHIRCKASTTITFATVGTVTGITYNIEGTVVQFQ